MSKIPAQSHLARILRLGGGQTSKNLAQDSTNFTHFKKCDLDSHHSRKDSQDSPQNCADSRNFDLRDSRYDSTTHLASYKKRDFSALSEYEKREGYVFHIFSDFLSEDSRARFAHLARDLSAIYPCEIKIHICDSRDFSGLPSLNGNHLAYFRFFIPRFMPKTCASCLYLDIDMLVVGDLRELFTLDMGANCVGVVKDKLNNTKKLRSKNANRKDIYFSGTYFNSGFLLLNLRAWENERITERSFEIMANYHITLHDQDALNAAIPSHLRLYLPFNFNLLVHTYIYAICKGESLRYKFDFTRKEMDSALKNPIILHYTTFYKPWNNAWIMNKNRQILSEIWWKVAQETLHFSDILQSEFEKLSKNSDKIFENRVAFYLLKYTKNPLKFFALGFVARKIFGKKAQNFLDSRESRESCDKLNPRDYNFAFELFHLCQKSYKRRKRGDLIILPLRALRLKWRIWRFGVKSLSVKQA